MENEVGFDGSDTVGLSFDRRHPTNDASRRGEEKSELGVFSADRAQPSCTEASKRATTNEINIFDHTPSSVPSKAKRGQTTIATLFPSLDFNDAETRLVQ